MIIYNSRLLLILMPVLCLVTLLLMRRYQWQKNLVVALTAPVHRQRLLLFFSLGKKKIGAYLMSIALLFLAVALARPGWGIDRQEHEHKTRDILFLLDVSRSMLAQDRSPTRIACAQKKIEQLVSALGADRVGLLLFSSTPVLYCPLTTDHEAFFTLLKTVAVPQRSGSTDIAQALEKACAVFERMPSRKHKIILMFTDGEDFSPNLAQVKEKLVQLGIHSVTVGVGTHEGAPIPCIDSNGTHRGYEKDAQNNIIISRLNEQLLKALAQESGAVYSTITETDQDIQAIANYCQRFEKEYYTSTQVAVHKERYYWFGLVSFMCLLLEWFL